MGMTPGKVRVYSRQARSFPFRFSHLETFSNMAEADVNIGMDQFIARLRTDFAALPPARPLDTFLTGKRIEGFPSLLGCTYKKSAGQLLGLDLKYCDWLVGDSLLVWPVLGDLMFPVTNQRGSLVAAVAGMVKDRGAPMLDKP